MLAERLDDAVDRGVLTEDEREDVLRTGVVTSGRRRNDGTSVSLLAEVSAVVDAHEVERAARRAELLAKLGLPVMAIAAGNEIDGETLRLAETRGVWTVMNGAAHAPLGA
jgi:hypothetical protein